VLADYFFTRKRTLLADDLFTIGAYWYTKGINWIAFGCLAVGSFMFWLGRYLQIGGAIPSFLLAGFIYLIVTKNFGRNEHSPEKEV